MDSSVRRVAWSEATVENQIQEGERVRHGMVQGNQRKNLECRCTRCQYNNNGNCGYQGRVVINTNGECEVREDGFGRDRFPY